MSQVFKEKELKEIANFKNGKSSPKRDDSFKFSVYGSNGEIGFSNEFNSNEKTIIIGRVGSYCGSVYFSNDKCWVTDNAIIGKAKEGNDPKFLFYLLKNINLNNYKAGSGQPLLNQKILYSIKMLVPSFSEQKIISNILSSLDEKIELNQRMNKALEEIGRAIFKHWFVDFEFPDEQGRPYKSSGGEMVDSELGEIPKGWEVGKIKDFGKVICGKTPPKSKSEYFGGDIPFIKIPDMHGETFVVKTEDSLTEEGKNFQKNKTIPAKSVCVSCIATVGLVCLTDRNIQTNQQINSIVPKEEFYSYYFYYKLNLMNEFLQILASGGSATLNLNTTNFSNIELFLPNDQVLKNFHITLDPLFNQILNNIHQIHELSQIRDSFLPKLMSGKIRVNGDE